jgi:hypothetical protein
MQIATVYDQKRMCGWRREGVYLVSASNTAGGNGLQIDDTASGLIVLDPPVPVISLEIPKRGFAYIDGEAVLRARRDQLHIPQFISPEMAEARAFSWRAFGMRFSDRSDQGLAVGLTKVADVVAKLSARDWRDHENFLHWAAEMNAKVQTLRNGHNDSALLPLIIAARQLHAAAYHDGIPGYVIQGAGGGIAAAWRLLHAARWAATGERGVREAVASRLLPSAGASPDIGYALRYKAPDFRIPPDMIDWVGYTHYPYAIDYIAEARRLGISRRMPRVPKAAIPTWTRVFLAHAYCQLADSTIGPGIFGYYNVSQVQYVLPENAGMERVPRDLMAGDIQPVRPVHVQPMEVARG